MFTYSLIAVFAECDLLPFLRQMSEATSASAVNVPALTGPHFDHERNKKDEALVQTLSGSTKARHRWRVCSIISICQPLEAQRGPSASVECLESNRSLSIRMRPGKFVYTRYRRASTT